MIQWPVQVNKKIRRATDGNIKEGVILEETRCGKKQSRPAEQLAPNTYNIEMLFNKSEFYTFKNWFETNLRKGALTFAFPEIFTQITDNEYRIVGGFHWENPSAEKFRITMTWEEV